MVQVSKNSWRPSALKGTLERTSADLTSTDGKLKFTMSSTVQPGPASVLPTAGGNLLATLWPYWSVGGKEGS